MLSCRAACSPLSGHHPELALSCSPGAGCTGHGVRAFREKGAVLETLNQVELLIVPYGLQAFVTRFLLIFFWSCLSGLLEEALSCSRFHCVPVHVQVPGRSDHYGLLLSLAPASSGCWFAGHPIFVLPWELLFVFWVFCQSLFLLQTRTTPSCICHSLL